MSISSSRQAYPDCTELFERAIDDPRGVRIWIGDEGKARHFIMRMHQCRQINRNDNAKIYPDPGHPLHGSSEWDPLRCTMRVDSEGEWWVYVEKVKLNTEMIESLAEIEGEFTEVKRVEHQAKLQPDPPKPEPQRLLSDLRRRV